ncbi:MAG: PqqD family protein [Desulfobacteraceae bacterium]|uniref:PqqD family protein n=1 Tax=Candidatus Desulfacyla euxinica TaxID=2841693 RepID=A0A8J6N1N2_9DELT|nr:PqqD family protein [Candidatus Desulfacyla euxinica]MBL6978766.1 PqqD family protein [Desulfobacteraceae bacterium]
MNNQRSVMLGRRGFVLTVAGTFCGVLFSGGRSLYAEIPKIRGIVRDLERDLIEKSRPMRDPSFLCRTAGDKTGLFRKTAGGEQPICRMNRMGRFIWETCNGKNTPREISRLIEQKCAVSHAKAYEDSLPFLVELKNAGAIRI